MEVEAAAFQGCNSGAWVINLDPSSIPLLGISFMEDRVRGKVTHGFKYPLMFKGRIGGNWAPQSWGGGGVIRREESLE